VVRATFLNMAIRSTTNTSKNDHPSYPFREEPPGLFRWGGTFTSLLYCFLERNQQSKTRIIPAVSIIMRTR